MLNLKTPIQSRLLADIPGLTHGFTSKDMPQPEREKIIDHTAIAKQVHGADFIWVTQVEREIRPADAVLTLTPGLPIGVFSADCVPTLIAAQDIASGKVVASAAIHGSWRCTSYGLPEKTFSELISRVKKDFPEKTVRYFAAIGPCISFDSFEVHDDVLKKFPGAEERGLARYVRDEDGRRKYLIDLPGETQRQLHEIAKKENVELKFENLGLCTVKHPDQFPSHRRRDRKPMGGILSFLMFE